MKRWVCPHCEAVQECIGHEVTHRCPKNRNRVTRFTRVYQEEDEA